MQACMLAHWTISRHVNAHGPIQACIVVHRTLSRYAHYHMWPHPGVFVSTYDPVHASIHDPMQGCAFCHVCAHSGMVAGDVKMSLNAPSLGHIILSDRTNDSAVLQPASWLIWCLVSRNFLWFVVLSVDLHHFLLSRTFGFNAVRKLWKCIVCVTLRTWTYCNLTQVDKCMISIIFDFNKDVFYWVFISSVFILRTRP